MARRRVRELEEAVAKVGHNAAGIACDISNVNDLNALALTTYSPSDQKAAARFSLLGSLPPPPQSYSQPYDLPFQATQKLSPKSSIQFYQYTPEHDILG